MRSDDALLSDIVVAAKRILTFTAGIGRDEFKANELMQSAVLHELMVIGEASRSISDETKVRYPLVDWRGLRSMRNAVVHVYFAIDLDVVWDTIQDDIPSLIQQLDTFMPPDAPQDQSP